MQRRRTTASMGILCLVSAVGLAFGVGAEAKIHPAQPSELRAMGPAALDQLLEFHADRIKMHLAGKEEDPASWRTIATTIDAVAAQRDAWASRLYWYTNLDDAKKAAKESGRPILSLRLLGRLDEDLSCANSRFFRKTLYVDPTISAYLREHFVLHWQSVRPVPKITIDFGDGRTMRRTITGNSIHYVLNADGAVIDGLPGLHGPAAFLRWLEATEKVSHDDASALRAYHADQTKAIAAAWEADLKTLGIAATPIPQAAPAEVQGFVDPLARPIDDSVWLRLAALHADDAKLNPAVTAVLRPNPRAVADMSRSKAFVENPMIVAVRNLSKTIALDTVRNEYTLHRRLHDMLAVETPALRNVDTLNTIVYRDLFLMPMNDPWCGLNPPDAYSAIDDDGTTPVATALAR